MSINVVAIEDDRRYRASLETLFGHAPDFTLIASFDSAVDAVERADDGAPGGPIPRWDLVLVDLELPSMHGIEAIRRLKAALPQTAVVALTVFEEPKTVLEAICAGADGYLVKRTAPDDLLAELRVVMRGGAPLSSGVARTVLNLLRGSSDAPDGEGGASPARLDLTDRQREVLRCLVQGMSYRRAARHLGISVETVRSHVKRIYAKLQVHSAAQAVSKAIRERLI
ncbi:MAG: response regulator [Gemmatimonadota bacterium]